VGGKKDLVYGESLGELTPGGVQLGLLLMHPDQHVAEAPLDAEVAGGVEAGLRPVGGPQETLGLRERQHVLRQRVRVFVIALVVAPDRLAQGPFGHQVVPVLDLDDADGVEHRRVEREAVPLGQPLHAADDLLGPAVLAGGVLGVRVVVEHAHEQPGVAELDRQLFRLRVALTGGFHRAGHAERIGQLGPVPHVHVGAGLLVEQLDGEHGMLQTLGGIAQVPVDVGPDQVGAGLQGVVVVVLGPLVDLPDLPGRRRHVTLAHPHVGLAEPGPEHQPLVPEGDRLFLDLDRGRERDVGIPQVLILDVGQGGRQLRRVVLACFHRAHPSSVIAPHRPPRGPAEGNRQPFQVYERCIPFPDASPE
jgi:hypothetical protein